MPNYFDKYDDAPVSNYFDKYDDPQQGREVIGPDGFTPIAKAVLEPAPEQFPGYGKSFSAPEQGVGSTAAKSTVAFNPNRVTDTNDIENVVRDVIAPTPARAAAQAVKGGAGLTEFIGDVAGSDFLVEKAKEWRKQAESVEAQIQKEHPLNEGSWSEAGAGALSSMYLQAPLMTAGMLANGVKAGANVALGGLSAITGGETYGERRGQGFGKLASAGSAAFDATVEYLTEKIPTETLLDMLGGKKAIGALAKKVGVLYGSEAVGESIATLLQDTNAKIMSGPGLTGEERAAKVKEYLVSGEAKDNWVQTLKTTAIQTTLMGGGASLVNRALKTAKGNDKALPRDPHEVMAALLEAEDEQSAADMLSQENPETVSQVRELSLQQQIDQTTGVQTTAEIPPGAPPAGPAADVMRPRPTNMEDFSDDQLMAARRALSRLGTPDVEMETALDEEAKRRGKKLAAESAQVFQAAPPTVSSQRAETQADLGAVFSGPEFEAQQRQIAEREAATVEQQKLARQQEEATKEANRQAAAEQVRAQIAEEEGRIKLQEELIPVEDRKRMKREALEEVNANPVYSHMAQARTEALNLNEIKNDYTTNSLKDIPGYQSMFSSAGRVSPDDFADRMGYESLDAMIETFKAAPAKKVALTKAYAAKLREWTDADTQAGKNEIAEIPAAEVSPDGFVSVGDKMVAGSFRKGDIVVASINGEPQEEFSVLGVDPNGAVVFKGDSEKRVGVFEEIFVERLKEGERQENQDFEEEGVDTMSPSGGKISQKRTFEPLKVSSEKLPANVKNEWPVAGGGRYFHATAEELQVWLETNGDGFLYRRTEARSITEEGIDGGNPRYKHQFPTFDAKTLAFSSDSKNAKALVSGVPNAIVYRIRPTEVAAEFTIQVFDGEKGVIHVHSPNNADFNGAEIIADRRKQTVPANVGERVSEAVTDNGRRAEGPARNELRGADGQGEPGLTPSVSPTTKSGKPKSAKAIAAQKKKLQPDLPGAETAPGTAPAAPATEAPSTSPNTVFTDDAAAKAREILRNKLGQVNMGLDPEMMQAGITLTGYHIEKGARTFAAYSKAMVDDLGEMIKPYLKSWYSALRYDPRASAFSADLDGDDVVAKFDLDAAETAPVPGPEQALSPETPARQDNTEGAGLPPGDQGDGKFVTDAPAVSHVTKRGRTLHGGIATGLTKEQAEAIDPATWRKDGGYFIRMKYVERPVGKAAVEQPPVATQVDEAAHVAATSPLNGKPEPTSAQKEAGNYAKGHVTLHGLNITIENPAGSQRSNFDTSLVQSLWDQANADGNGSTGLALERSLEYARNGDYAEAITRLNIAKGRARENGNKALGAQIAGAAKRSWVARMPEGVHYGYIKRTEGADGDHVDVFVGPNPELATAFIINQKSPSDGKFDEHKVMLGFKDMASAKAAYLKSFEPMFGNQVFQSMTGDIQVGGLKAQLPKLINSRPVSVKATNAPPVLSTENDKASDKPGRTATVEQGELGQWTVSKFEDGELVGRKDAENEAQAITEKLNWERGTKPNNKPLALQEGDIDRAATAGYNAAKNGKVDAEGKLIQPDWIGGEEEILAFNIGARRFRDESTTTPGATDKASPSVTTGGVEKEPTAVSSVRKTKSLVRIRPTGPLGNEYSVTFADGQTIYSARGLNRDEAVKDARKTLARQAEMGERSKVISSNPWMATQAEYVAEFTGSGPLRAGLVADHKNSVKTASSEGKPVPAEVLADYPDLTQTPTPQKDKGGEATPDEDQARRENPNIKATLLNHNETVERLASGKATIAEYKAGFQRVVNSAEELKAELSDMTKAALLERMNDWYAARYKNEKKDRIVRALYDDMLTDFWVENGTFSYGMDGILPAMKKAVNATTDETLKEHAAAVKEAAEERAAAREQTEEAIKDPKTLDDYRKFFRAKMGDTKTFREVYREATPEQRAAFDSLSAAETRAERVAALEKKRTSVQVAGQTTDAVIVEGEHSKLHYPIWSVQLADKVDGDSYKTLLSTAKRMGGNYVNTMQARMWKTVWGFQFRDKASAEAFLKLAAGDKTEAQEKIKERRDSFADDRSQSAVERLTEMAERLDDRADDTLSADRKTNTSRRAEMAGRAEANANREKAMAQTMRNIANAIEDGSAKMLDQVRQKVQVELLQSYTNRAHYEQLREKYPAYIDYERNKDSAPDTDTPAFVEFPQFTAYRSDLAKLGRQLQEIPGTKKLGASLLKVADDVTDAYLKFAKENLHKVSTFTNRSTGALASFSSKLAAEESIERSGYRGKAIVLPFKRNENLIILSPTEAKERGVWQGDDDKRITLRPDFGEEIVAKVKSMGRRQRVDMPWMFETAATDRARLAAIGLETPAELRAALREFINLREAPKQASKIKELERAMIGRVKDGLDFFPTPTSVASEMVETAGITEGMKVLEPSAGMGHIAEQVREAGVEPDVIEMGQARRELLEVKGFNVVGRDFMDLTEGGYDRIVMNPPFSDRRDSEHVQHAFTLLNPGGRIVAIMGEGVFFGQDKKAVQFRAWLEEVGGTAEKLDEGTFLDPSLPVNTATNARMVVIDKPTVGEPLYSESYTQPTGNTVSQVRKELSSILSAKALFNKARLEVVQSVGQLPEHIGKFLKSGEDWTKRVERARELSGLRAAIKDPETGEIYSGWSHQAAINKAPKNGTPEYEKNPGVWGRLWTEWDQSTDNVGFLDERGNFVSRSVAEKRWGILTMEDRRDALKPIYSQDGSIAGAFDPSTKKIWLVADTIKPGEVVGVAKHEILHRLLRTDEKFMARYDSLLGEFEALRGSDPRVETAFSRVPSDTPAHLKAEEALAYAVQAEANVKPGKGLGERARFIIKKIVAHIRAWLNTHGFKMKLTTDDILAMIDQGIKRDIRRSEQGEAGQSEDVRGMVPAFSKTEIIAHAKAFYSKLLTVVSGKFDGLKAQSVENWLSKQGVKKAELEATGVKEWLAAKKPTDKVSQQELSDFVLANTVELEDVVMGGESQDKPDGQITILGEDDEYYTFGSMEEAIGDAVDSGLFAGGRQAAEEWIVEHRTDRPTIDATHFSQYTEPGAVEGSYREMFVTAPGAASGYKVVPYKGTNAWGVKFLSDGEVAGPYSTKEAAEKEVSMMGASGWQDGHSQYSEVKNPVVRIRFNTVETADGKTALRIEEMQGPSAENQKKMPAYLRDNIYNLGVKRILAYAKENGFDGVALATKPGRTAGETQADRYSLEKQVDELRYTPSDFTLDGYKDGKVSFSQTVAPDKLGDVIGKEAAKRLLASEIKPGRFGATRAGQHSLSGEGLKFGGEGLKQLYDTQLPRLFEAYGKGKMGEVSVATGKEAIPGQLNLPLKLRDTFSTMPYISLQNSPDSFPLFSKQDKGPLFSRQHMGDLEQDQIDSLENVGGITKPVPASEYLKEHAKKLTDEAVQGIADQFAPLKELDHHAYLLARLSKAYDGALEALLLFGNLNLKDGVTDAEAGKTPGFFDVMAQLQGEQQRFLWWIAANRAARLKAEGKENRFTDQDISALQRLNTGTMKDGTPRHQLYRKVHAEFNRISKNVLDIAEESGLIDGESRQVWEQEFYVPFYRVIEDSNGAVQPTTKGGLTGQYAFKKLRGGYSKLNSDLMANVLNNWGHLLAASAKNRAATAALKSAERAGIAVKVPKGTKGTVFIQGTDVYRIPVGQTYIEDGIEKVSDGTAEIEQHGEIHYLVEDDAVLDAVTSLEWSGFNNVAMRVMGKMKRALTIGVTANPSFKIRNLIRDSLQAIAIAEMSYNPMANVAEGWRVMAGRKSQEYASLLAGGGTVRFGTMIEGNRAGHVHKLINAGVKSETILDTTDKVKSVFTELVDGYNNIGDISEGVNRAAIYSQRIAAGDSHAEASLAARDLLDFTMGGKWTTVRFLTQVAPFLNARIQGTYKLGRSAKANPGRFATVAFVMGLASIGLLLHYNDDDDWKKREDWDRDNYWWFKLGNTAYRIPKPFEVGAIATTFERSAELWVSDEMTKERFFERLKFLVHSTFAFDLVPQAFRPALNLIGNEDKFTGRPIESMGMERLSKPERIGPSTSSIGITAGQAGEYTGLSPVQIDYLVRGYLGWLGATTLAATDIASEAVGLRPEGPSREVQDMFVIGNFAEQLPSSRSRYVTEFYEQSKELAKYYADYQAAVKRGDISHAREIREEHRPEIIASRKAEKIQRRIAELNNQARQIRFDQDMDASVKRKRLDEIEERKDKLARKIKVN